MGCPPFQWWADGIDDGAMTAHRVLLSSAVAIVLVVLAACASAPAGSQGAASQEGSGRSDGSNPPTTGAAPSSGPAASDGGTAVGDDCEERLSESWDAASTLTLTWEGIGYYVLDDAGWQDQVAQGHIDAAAYRAAAELLQDVPDADNSGTDRGLWSEHSAAALELAGLLDQAAASGTPFADGIGEQMRDDASELQFDAGTLVHFTVDHMCDDPADDLPAAGVDEIVVLLVPPSSTEASRNTSPTYSTFEYLSTESIDALRSFYEDAFADASWEVFWTDTYRESGTYWDINLPDGRRLTVSVNPAESGSGTTAEIDIYGE